MREPLITRYLCNLQTQSEDRVISPAAGARTQGDRIPGKIRVRFAFQDPSGIKMTAGSRAAGRYK